LKDNISYVSNTKVILSQPLLAAGYSDKINNSKCWFNLFLIEDNNCICAGIFRKILIHKNNYEEVMQEYKLRILDMQKEERPRERLIKNGAAALSDSELLAIILRTGSRQENVINLSQRLLSEYNLKQLSTINIAQLMNIHGIKESKAAQIAACFEIARRLESFNEEVKPKVNSPEDVYRRIYPRMREQKKENFIELCLDTKNQIIREEIISI
jgi:hypothetical protein